MVLIQHDSGMNVIGLPCGNTSNCVAASCPPPPVLPSNAEGVHAATINGKIAMVGKRL